MSEPPNPAFGTAPEKAVRRIEDELRDTIDTIPALVWSTLPDGSLEFLNRRWLEYTGLSLEEGIGRGWESVVHPEDLAEYLAHRSASLNSGQAREGEIRVRRADGQYRWWFVRTVPLRDESGNIVRWYGAGSPHPGSIEEAVAEMAKLKSEGKIRYIGVSNFNVEQMERAQRIAPITSLQPPYSLVATDVQSAILPYALMQKMGVIVYSPMGSGLLTGAMTRERIAAMPEDDWRRRSPNFQEPQLSRNLQLVERLREVGKRHGATPGEVAIAWTLKNAAVTAAIVGVRSPQQVQGVAGAAGLELTDAEVAEIEDHLVPEAA